LWPPNSSKEERKELGKQRDEDISIKGRTGPIKKLEQILRMLDHEYLEEDKIEESQLQFRSSAKETIGEFEILQEI